MLSITRSIAVLVSLWPVVSLPAAAKGPDAARTRTLSIGDRLKQPFLKTPVRPKRKLTIGRGGTEIEVVAEGESLVARILSTGADVPIEAGKPARLALDPASAETATVAFVRGDVDSGEPDWWLLGLDVLEGRIGPVGVTFFDGDGDGTFFTPFADFFVEKTRGRLYPVAPVVVADGQAYSVRYDEAKRTVDAATDRDFADEKVFPLWGDVVRGLAYVNDVRGRMGLFPFGLDPVASHHAMLHAEYCARNGVFQHQEDPSKPGYTTEGMRAGLRSIGSRMGSVPSSIEEFLTTLLHRMPLIDPRLCEIGIGANGSQVWIETESGARRRWIEQGPVVFPGPDGKWHDGAMAMERPDPRPAGVTASVGLPVTIGFYGDENASDVRAALFLGKSPVECFKFDDETKDLEARYFVDPKVAVLMPKRTLSHKAYRLELTWRHGGRDRRLVRSVAIKG